jgi:transposase
MLGHKVRDVKQHVAISLDALVPQDNFYRQVDQCIDLSFVRDLAAENYSSFGRPSIDPVVFIRLQLIAFFEGIRSERQLMERVNLNLAHRWFIGYDLDEPVPDHSSLSEQDPGAIRLGSVPAVLRTGCGIVHANGSGVGRRVVFR